MDDKKDEDFLTKLKSLDLYPKTLDDLKERTLGGAAISLVCSIIICVLAVSEMKAWLRVEVSNTLGVDMRGETNLSINLDIYFPSLPCNEMVVDMTDVSGAQRLNVQTAISKLRMNRDGVPIEVPMVLEIGGSVAPAFKHRKVMTLMEDVTEKLEATEIAMDKEENSVANEEEHERQRNLLKNQVVLFGEKLKNFVDHADPESPEEVEVLNHGKRELDHVKKHISETNIFNDAEKDFILKNINAMHRNFERIQNGTTDKVRNNLKEALRIRLSILNDNTKGFILNDDLERRERYDGIENTLKDISEHMDEMDLSMEEKIDVQRRMDELRGHLTELQEGAKGEKAVELQDNIQKEMKELLGEIKGDPQDREDYCGPCYGAQENEGQCCNTCEAVKAAYRKKRWGLPSEDALEQCRRQKKLKAVQYEEGEGCNVFGTLDVSKVSGHLMIAPGVSTKHCDGRGCHILHEFTHADVSHFNISHKINRLSFGEDYPGRKNPLDDSWLHSVDGPGVSKYFLKVVPTTYMDIGGAKVITNQFAVTEYFKAVNVETNKFTMPGVFINYDFTPFEVKYTQQKGSTFGKFFTRSAAILGGVFSVAGIVDSMVYHSSRLLAKKLAVGKLT